MPKKQKVLIARVVIIFSVIPILLWAYETGPDAGYSAVPGEFGSCAASGCHVGTANSPANKGSVSVNFPNGQNYTPGVKQHWTVTISDPAAPQRAWGFQITTRLASNSNAQAGTFSSSDQFTGVECASSNLRSESALLNLPNQTCPGSMPLQYIEHDVAGYTHTKGTGSGTYEFDWTPPDSDAGQITVYIAGNAANGDLTTNGDHIYTTSYTLSPQAGGGGPQPAISQNGVVNGASFQVNQGITAGSWVSIFGSNLANTSRQWTDQDIVNNNLPTSLDGVSVTIDGKPAYVEFINDKQINVQAPADTNAGPVELVVNNNGTTSDSFTVQMQPYSPAFFEYGGKYAIATRYPEGTLIGDPAATPGTVAAKPGDILILWGTGFGPTSPAVPPGVVPQVIAPATTATPTITIGNVNVQLVYSVLSQFAGLYQVAVQLPNGLPSGDVPIHAAVQGTQSPDNVFIRMQ
ncbi:MAG TPA: choice-of-anchor V domain-containing protein [Bryobacteraceae bacterium]|nr:choice-of-anchor V domain-containing protein [Bryobacteraceae bacterium]